MRLLCFPSFVFVFREIFLCLRILRSFYRRRQASRRRGRSIIIQLLTYRWCWECFASFSVVDEKRILRSALPSPSLPRSTGVRIGERRPRWWSSNDTQYFLMRSSCWSIFLRNFSLLLLLCSFFETKEGRKLEHQILSCSFLCFSMRRKGEAKRRRKKASGKRHFLCAVALFAVVQWGLIKLDDEKKNKKKKGERRMETVWSHRLLRLEIDTFFMFSSPLRFHRVMTIIMGLGPRKEKKKFLANLKRTKRQ